MTVCARPSHPCDVYFWIETGSDIIIHLGNSLENNIIINSIRVIVISHDVFRYFIFIYLSLSFFHY